MSHSKDILVAIRSRDGKVKTHIFQFKTEQDARCFQAKAESNGYETITTVISNGVV